MMQLLLSITKVLFEFNAAWISSSVEPHLRTAFMKQNIAWTLHGFHLVKLNQQIYTVWDNFVDF